jgi:hypothetical protein
MKNNVPVNVLQLSAPPLKWANVYAREVPSDDDLSAIQFLNENEERSRSPIWKFAKDAIALISEVLPPAGIFLGAIENKLDRREASNRAELISALVERVRKHSQTLDELIAKSETHSRFFTDEFPGLVVEAARRSETVRSKERIRRFAAILTHSLEVGPQDGADYVEEMLWIATELSDQDVKVLDTASREFVRERAKTPEADTIISARAWLQMRSGIAGDELASIGAKLQSFGLTSRIEGHTVDMNSYRVLDRGRRFIEYILGDA